MLLTKKCKAEKPALKPPKHQQGEYVMETVRTVYGNREMRKIIPRVHISKEPQLPEDCEISGHGLAQKLRALGISSDEII